MKTDMRRALAQQSFEEKIREVDQLIHLSATVKSARDRERAVETTDARPPALRAKKIPSGAR
ncbi:MAG: hypothetical protein H0X40_11795 [Chthoniobacterales bacterium]|nr:hypothetical protein [Chthoniobacterales bacterium]